MNRNINYLRQSFVFTMKFSLAVVAICSFEGHNNKAQCLLPALISVLIKPLPLFPSPVLAYFFYFLNLRSILVLINMVAAITAYRGKNCVSVLIKNPGQSECFSCEVRLSPHGICTIIQLSRREIYLDLHRQNNF